MTSKRALLYCGNCETDRPENRLAQVANDPLTGLRCRSFAYSLHWEQLYQPVEKEQLSPGGDPPATRPFVLSKKWLVGEAAKVLALGERFFSQGQNSTNHRKSVTSPFKISV
jgi:hypothetical protein